MALPNASDAAVKEMCCVSTAVSTSYVAYSDYYYVRIGMISFACTGLVAQLVNAALS